MKQFIGLIVFAFPGIVFATGAPTDIGANVENNISITKSVIDSNQYSAEVVMLQECNCLVAVESLSEPMQNYSVTDYGLDQNPDLVDVGGSKFALPSGPPLIILSATDQIRWGVDIKQELPINSNVFKPFSDLLLLPMLC